MRLLGCSMDRCARRPSRARRGFASFSLTSRWGRLRSRAGAPRDVAATPSTPPPAGDRSGHGRTSRTRARLRGLTDARASGVNARRNPTTTVGIAAAIDPLCDCDAVGQSAIRCSAPCRSFSPRGRQAVRAPCGPSYSGCSISTAPTPSSGPSMMNMSIVISGSTCAWLRNASTWRPVSCSIACV